MSYITLYIFVCFCSCVSTQLFTDESRLPLFLLRTFALSCMHQQSRMDDEPNCARATSGKQETIVFTNQFVDLILNLSFLSLSLLFRVFWVVCAVGSLLWSTDI